MTKKSMRAMLVLVALLAFCGSGLAGQTLDKMKAQIHEKTLKNGMKFIVMEQHEAPVASFHVYADVGSAQESYGITGISHILEHMAFKGTTSVGTKDYAAEAKVLDELDQVYEKLSREQAKLKPDDGSLKELKARFEELQQKAKEYVVNNEYFDMVMQQGDAGVNAYTNYDATQYTNSLPANKLEFWMAITSDRFLNPVFREFYKERDVIMEERRLGLETQPMGKLIEDFMAVAYKAHPYHHHVIGHMSDLQRISHQDVKDYFKKYYSPSNLTAAIVGDVDPQEVFRLAELYFGRIPSGPRPEPLRTREPEQWGERRATVTAQSQPVLLVGYHKPDVASSRQRCHGRPGQHHRPGAFLAHLGEPGEKGKGRHPGRLLQQLPRRKVSQPDRLLLHAQQGQDRGPVPGADRQGDREDQEGAGQRPGAGQVQADDQEGPDRPDEVQCPHGGPADLLRRRPGRLAAGL